MSWCSTSVVYSQAADELTTGGPLASPKVGKVDASRLDLTKAKRSSAKLLEVKWEKNQMGRFSDTRGVLVMCRE